MKSRLLFILFVAGCNAAPAGVAIPDPISSPLPKGVYTGRAECETTTISPSGDVSVENIPLTVTFEINDNGIPIVQGDVIRVGRTVEIGQVSATYTRIEPTSNGIVWHFDVSALVGNSTAGGIATSELRTTETSSLEYRFTQAVTDSGGTSINQSCIFTLSP